MLPGALDCSWAALQAFRPLHGFPLQKPAVGNLWDEGSSHDCFEMNSFARVVNFAAHVTDLSCGLFCLVYFCSLGASSVTSTT